MIKTNCELPLCMLGENYELNDYDFVLFHLYISNEQYREYYRAMRKIHPNRKMIMDNSAYEFFVKGKQLNLAQYKVAIEDLQPDYYIMPDVLMDKDATLKGIETFLKDLPNCGKPIAIAQGKTEQELIDCLYEYRSSGILNIGIPFHNSFFKDIDLNDQNTYIYVTHFAMVYGIDLQDLTEDMKYAVGRVVFVSKHRSLLNKFDYVHFLGSHCPFEKTFYKNYDSMDTGYPVKLGYEQVILGDELSKPNVIIDDFLNNELSTDQKRSIRGNIKEFKRY